MRTRNARPATGILLAIALLAAGSALRAQVPPTPAERCAAQAGAARTLVSTAYALLAEFTTLDDYDLAFKLDGFQVQDRAGFLAEPWDSRFRPSRPVRIGVERIEVLDESDLVGVHYEPNLEAAPAPAAELDERPMAEVLGSEADHFAEGAGCFLTFGVEASIERIQIIYRGFAAWPGNESPALTNLQLFDPVTRVVDLALRETATVGRGDDLMTERARRQIERYGRTLTGALSITGPMPGDSPDTICSAQTKHYRPPRIEYGPDGSEHIPYLGFHKSAARFDFACSCDEQCTSFCTPSITTSECTETGGAISVLGLPKEHRRRSREAGFESFRAEAVGQGQGASCSIGFACFIESCLFGCGGPLPVLTALGSAATPVTFASSVAALWEGYPSSQGTCDHCREALPPLRVSGARHGILYPDTDAGLGAPGGLASGSYVPDQKMVCFQRWQADPPMQIEYCIIIAI